MTLAVQQDKYVIKPVLSEVEPVFHQIHLFNSIEWWSFWSFPLSWLIPYYKLWNASLSKMSLVWYHTFIRCSPYSSLFFRFSFWIHYLTNIGPYWSLLDPVRNNLSTTFSLLFFIASLNSDTVKLLIHISWLKSFPVSSRVFVKTFYCRPTVPV
jgi:hypothetical protein